MTARGLVSGNALRIRLVIATAVFLAASACASYNCAFDVAHHPDPVSIHVEDGVVYGQNYIACFLIDGVIHREYIPECAYRYYYDRQARRAAAGMQP